MLTGSGASHHDEPVMAFFPRNVTKTEKRAGGEETILFLFFRKPGSVFVLGFISRANSSNFQVS